MRILMTNLATLILLITSATTSGIPAFAEEQIEQPEKVTPFALKDFRGKQHSLEDLADSRFVVAVFLGTECPLAKLYGPRLAELHAKYSSRGVAFIGVNPNQQDSLTEIAAHARRHGLKFPVLKDTGNRLADQLSVTRTPEVVVWDQDEQIRYRGRIDNQYGVGYIRAKGTQHDLVNALDELLAGREVTVAKTEAVGCLIGRVRQPDPDSTVTYSNQVARILQKRCVECHREGEIAPFTLGNYDDVVGWAEMIAEVVDEGRMPPWHADPAHGKFSNDRRLTSEERRQLIEWATHGAPEGDPAELPEPRTFLVGTQLPQEADRTLKMSPTPFTVKAEGEIAYQNFEVDPEFKEDKWITMAEALPGNRAVVHHIVIFVKPPETKEATPFAPGLQYLTTYVPGYLARPLTEGKAKFVPAGSKFVFQMHYTPIGIEQEDLSTLRLVYTDRDKVDEIVLSGAVSMDTRKLVIPAHAGNHRSVASEKVGYESGKLISLFPHMHLRGKSFKVTAKYDSGKEDVLLDVPNYDFNWQTTYRLSEGKELPKGTEIEIVGHHDNSEDNLANPDPSEEVKWGDQTWEEMLILLYEWSAPLPEDALRTARATEATSSTRATSSEEEPATP